jgi:hypothetical protein
MHVLPSNDVWSSEDWRAFFDQRARVAEFDGGLPRPEAEARAFDCCVAEWLNRNFVRSPAGRCLACGAVGQDQEPLLPFGTESLGHAWLHSQCWSAWRAGLEKEAITALGEFGISAPRLVRGRNRQVEFWGEKMAPKIGLSDLKAHPYSTTAKT